MEYIFKTESDCDIIVGQNECQSFKKDKMESNPCDELRDCLKKIINYHTHDDSECKPSSLNAVDDCFVSFCIYFDKNMYVLKLFTIYPSTGERRMIFYNVNEYLESLLTCSALNPSKKLCYFEGDGLFYSYCEAITTFNKVNHVYPIKHVYVYCNFRDKMTFVEFYSIKEGYPKLKTCFKF